MVEIGWLLISAVWWLLAPRGVMRSCAWTFFCLTIWVELSLFACCLSKNPRPGSQMLGINLQKSIVEISCFWYGWHFGSWALSSACGPIRLRSWDCYFVFEESPRRYKGTRSGFGWVFSTASFKNSRVWIGCNSIDSLAYIVYFPGGETNSRHG